VNLLDALLAYHAIYSPLFPRREQREGAADYLYGLLLDIPRKSIEPMILALQGADANTVRAMQQFISAGAWHDAPILRQHWREVDTTLGDEDGVLTLKGSDFLKQGQRSVGAKRQYCHKVGKWANCQAGVFLGYASVYGYTLVDRRLYLPQEWIKDEAYATRRRKCGMPADLVFQTKPELGWEMIREVSDDQRLRCRWVTCDEVFGRDTAFLDQVARRGLWYCAEVPHDTQLLLHHPATAVPQWSGCGGTPTCWRLGGGQAEATAVAAVAASVPAGIWQRCVIKEGAKGPIVADFACRRVVAVREGLPGPEVWLLLRRHVDTAALTTYVCNAPPATALETLVRMSGMQGSIETCVEECKQYLGMGDYEVRSWRGWHHHMTLCILAHFFLVRQQQALQKTPRA
jgi:SRSO17 transposase